mmetsp:Transcript_4370/g.9016  ORF Transcript_4370/g.9016 Transcript_4370/m.9016 type:complete len:209 (+) Transcript_4370:1079-1705(+)
MRALINRTCCVGNSRNTDQIIVYQQRMSAAPRREWQVRPATRDDAASVNALLKASYEELLKADYEETILSNALPLITLAQEELLTCGTWYVVEHPETKQVVGCGGWTIRSPTSKGLMDAKGAPHLRHFACHPGWTRCGIASVIWQKTLADMKGCCGERLPCLEVYSTITATPFYGTLGFREVKRVEIPLNGGACMFPAVLMRMDSMED